MMDWGDMTLEQFEQACRDAIAAEKARRANLPEVQEQADDDESGS